MVDGRYLAHTEPPATYAFADVVVEPLAHRILRDGREIAVEPRAFAVLLHFLAHPGQLLGRDDLLDAVWGHSCVTPSTLSRVIAQLRRALDDDSDRPHCIQTVHGLGYRFIAAVTTTSASLRFAPPARLRVPARTETLIGRDEAIEHVARLLRDGRLVTIAGAGGIGKTQVALEVARRAEADFPDGIWLLDCTLQADGESIVRWLAGVFDLPAAAAVDELVARLCELLRQRRVLLVFDNCERIAPPLGQLVVALLAASTELRVLVTSQHRLNCAGESLCWLPPLAVPDAGEWSSPDAAERLAQVPAVQLLLVRSRAAASSFTLTPANAAAVAEICRGVDGLPLALEIAAARLRLLSPQQLLARMDGQLLSLADASSSRPARHQTLHALIAWSFALLSAHERALLEGLSVFAGGSTLGGACAIGAVYGLGDEAVLDLLEGLVDKSLLVVDVATNPPSYRLLDSVRLFAGQQLAERGDEARLRDAHLAHFVALAQQVDAEIRSDREQLWCERVRREWANLHEAFEYAMTRPGRAADALALIGDLCWYFRMSSNYREPAGWLERALAAEPSPTRQRAKALIGCGMLHYHAQVQDRAEALLREGVALAAAWGDDWMAAAGRAVLAFELAASGNTVEAEACAAAAARVAEAQADPWLASMALLGRGIALAMGRRHDEAEVCLSAALQAASEPGHGSYQLAYTLINRALLRVYLGRFADAASDWLADLDAFAGLRHWRGLAGCVEGTAYLCSADGRLPEAARFLAAAARVRELTDAPLMPQWREAQQVAERTVREGLGVSFASSWQAGAAARFEEIVADARMTLVAIANAQPPRHAASRPSGS